MALGGPSNRENGCMRVIPGSHELGGFSQYRPVDTTVQTFHAEVVDVDESKAVDFELERGQCSLHDGRIIHGAKANTSPLRRTGYTMRYFPASVKVMPVEQNAGWKVWLARGKDTAGNTYES
jgi:ectoine hydroxylase-related dioxygenase (phytanoyl-CoA dioxygenase family)